MIATFFEWRIDPAREDEFRSSWAEVTRRLQARGSNGSTLFRRDNANYCALARWPDMPTRDAAFAAEQDSEPGKRMRAIIIETVQRIDLDETDNLWLG